jgi:hypothetical protein
MAWLLTMTPLHRGRDDQAAAIWRGGPPVRTGRLRRAYPALQGGGAGGCAKDRSA